MAKRKPRADDAPKAQKRRGARPPQKPPRLPKARDRKDQAREAEKVRARVEKFDPVRWRTALDAKRRMPALSVGTFDPGPEALLRERKDAAGVLVASGKATRVEAAENPAPRGSLGYVGAFVKLDDDAQGTLLVRFDRKALGPIDPDTLRLFRYDEAKERFTLVRDSGIGRGDYVWGRASAPGVYGLIGLDRRPEVRLRIRSFCGMLQAEGLAGGRGGPNPVQERLCKVILCPADGVGFEADFDAKAGGDLGGRPGRFPRGRPRGGGPGIGNICERCLGLRPPVGGLPECDIPLGPGGHVPAWPAIPRADCGWESVGPRTIAGCVFQVLPEPGNPDCLYAATADGGIWRLESVAAYPSQTWVPLTDFEDNLVSGAIAVAPSNRDVVYYGDGLGTIVRSTDRAARWQRMHAVGIGWIRRILVHPTQPNTIYVAANGLYRSLDGGATWTGFSGATRLLDQEVTDLAMDPSDPRILYAGVRGVGVRKSMDGGETWSTQLPWSSVAATGSSMIKIALGAQGTDLTRTVVARMGDEVWVNRRGGRPETVPGGAAWESKGRRGSHQGDWDHCVAVDPFDDDHWLVGGIWLERTVDGGTNWTTVASYYAPHEDQQSLAFHPTSRGVVYLSNDGGVFRSVDGGATWEVRGPDGSIDRDAEFAARRDLNLGLVTAQFYRAGVAGDRSVANLYHSGILGARSLAGQSWEGIEGHAWEFRNVEGDPRRPRDFFVYGGTDLLRRTYPNPATGPALRQIAPFFPTCIASDTTSRTILVGSQSPGRIMRTLDGDTEPMTWTQEPGIGIGDERIASIAYSPARARLAYAASASGRVFRKLDANGSAAWEERGNAGVGSIVQISANAFHPDRLYALGTSGAARSDNAGQTWTPIPGTGLARLPPSPSKSIVASPWDPETVYVGLEIGVFLTLDDGRSWHAHDEGLPNAGVRLLIPNGDWLYAVTYGRGLWRRRIVH